MFGGTDGAGRSLEDTWVWDEGLWSLLAPPNHPCARHSTRMTLDATSTPPKLVLFGGSPGSDCSNQRGNLDDTWLWDGTTWALACTGCTTDQSKPSARRSEGLAWDGGDGFAILFGGFGTCGGHRSGACGDTWTWDAADDAWTRRCSGCKPGTTRPSNRGSPAIAYSERRSQLILYGGKGNTVLVGETWYWDNADDSWVKLARVNSPKARTQHRTAYDEINGQIVMFGGCAGDCFSRTQAPLVTVLNATWLLGSGRWRRASPTTPPPRRCCVGLAWDPSTSNGRVVLFGGATRGPSFFNDTWLWDGTNWCQTGVTCAETNTG